MFTMDVTGMIVLAAAKLSLKNRRVKHIDSIRKILAKSVVLYLNIPAS